MKSIPSRSLNFFIFIATLLILFISGCASYSDLPAGTVLKVSGSPIVEQQTIQLPPMPDEVPAQAYLIGPGDILSVTILGQSELGSRDSDSHKGSRVDAQGNLHLPLVGRVPVAGNTLSQVEDLLTERLKTYIKAPSVVIEITHYRSHPINLLGQFKKPGTFYMERPLTLLEGISLAGGMTDNANLRGARLIREGKTQAIDLHQLLQEGQIQQNVWLKQADTLFIPDNRNQNVFVFGAVKRPGAVTMPNGDLTLTQALASAGMDGTGNNEHRLRIIRSLSATHGELIVVDLDQILRGQSLPFRLTHGDIVYVPKSALGNWNDAIREILPSLQLVSTVLQPFVQIKFLTDD